MPALIEGLDAGGRRPARPAGARRRRRPGLGRAGRRGRRAAVPDGLELLLPGYLPLDLLAGFLGGADVVAYPSLAEGFGLPVLEAMACGAAGAHHPVAGAARGGRRRGRVRRADRGRRSPTACAALLDDAARRAELSAAAVRRARRRSPGRPAPSSTCAATPGPSRRDRSSRRSVPGPWTASVEQCVPARDAGGAAARRGGDLLAGGDARRVPGRHCRRRPAGRSRSSWPTTAPPTARPSGPRPGTPRPAAARPAATSGTARPPTPALADGRPGWALVANPDIRFEAGRGRRAARRRGAVAPGGARSARRSGRRRARSTPRRATSLAVDRASGTPCSAGLWPGNPWTARYRREREEPRERTAGWLSGSCFLVDLEAFHSVGGFDPAYFMYFEDVDLAERLGAPRLAARLRPLGRRRARGRARHPARAAPDAAGAPHQRPALPVAPLPAPAARAAALRPSGPAWAPGCCSPTSARASAPGAQPQRSADELPPPADAGWRRRRHDRRAGREDARAPRSDHGRRLGHAAVAAVPGRAGPSSCSTSSPTPRRRRAQPARRGVRRGCGPCCRPTGSGSAPPRGTPSGAGGAAPSCAPTGWCWSRSPATPPTRSGSAAALVADVDPDAELAVVSADHVIRPGRAVRRRAAHRLRRAGRPAPTRWSPSASRRPRRPPASATCSAGAPTGGRRRRRGGVVPGEARPGDRRGLPGVGGVPLELRHVRLAGADRARRAGRPPARVGRRAGRGSSPRPPGPERDAVLAEVFPTLPKISVDYAVLEPAADRAGPGAGRRPRRRLAGRRLVAGPGAHPRRRRRRATPSAGSPCCSTARATSCSATTRTTSSRWSACATAWSCTPPT